LGTSVREKEGLYNSWRVVKKRKKGGGTQAGQGWSQEKFFNHTICEKTNQIMEGVWQDFAVGGDEDQGGTIQEKTSPIVTLNLTGPLKWGIEEKYLKKGKEFKRGHER